MDGARPDRWGCRPHRRGRLVLLLGMRRHRERGQGRQQRKKYPGAPGNVHCKLPHYLDRRFSMLRRFALILAGSNYLVLLQIRKLESSPSAGSRQKRLQTREGILPVVAMKGDSNFACLIT
jgi:hypothetical protein